MKDISRAPEQLNRLWAPWRIEYIRQSREQACVLCTAPAQCDDQGALILHRGRFNFILMNAYPYSPGHLMVAPFRHTADLDDFSPEESAEHVRMVRLAVALLRSAAPPDGFNIGLNLGKVAGAGFDQHLHTHIVPRWLGDNNFMPVLADTRVISESLPAAYKRLKQALSVDESLQSLRRSC